ncbi:MAG: NifB/NifX family molybdenum-iron cluster-binding protein [Kiritimatiellia bacterium]
MRIAVPTVNGKLAAHFGHCGEFTMIEADPDAGTMQTTGKEPAPGHQPGLLPRWLAEHGAEMIIAGGMGRRAQDLFSQQGIRVIVGAPADDPEAVVRAWMNGKLQTGENLCDH